MKTKSLSHWVESFNFNGAPWLASDWDIVLNILSKLLYREIDEKYISNLPSEERRAIISFQEMFHLAETALGIPQFVVICDTKQIIAENQLAIFATLCVLKYATTSLDPKSYRDIVFTYGATVAFDMDVDDSSRYCAGCRQRVNFVERCVLDGRVWHRACMRCCVCKRQLYRGAFFADSSQKMECVEHATYQILYGDPMYRIILKPTQKITGTAITTALASPPPRPPPPKFGHDSEEVVKASEMEQSPSHRDSATNSMKSPAKQSPESSEKNWEMLNYPTELNPFGSDEEEPENGGFDLDFDEPTVKGVDSNNPFSADGSDEDVAAEESDIEEVENPVDRVQSSFDNNSFSPTNGESLSTSGGNGGEKSDDEKVYRRVCITTITKSREDNPFDDENDDDGDTGEDGRAKTYAGENDEKSSTRPKCHPPPPPKPPRLSDEDIDEGGSKLSRLLSAERKYYSPLSPMIYRHKASNITYGKTMAELSAQLRKLHCQLTQLETTGKRLEVQILRNIANGKVDWKKSKLIEEFLITVERRCDALRIESLLVRSYMDLFVTASHQELERQMHAINESNDTLNSKTTELTELLVQLMQMKNELLAVEQTPTSSRVNASAGPPVTASCKSVIKFRSPSALKKGVKQTMKTLKKRL